MLTKEKLEFAFMLYPYPDPAVWPALTSVARTADELGYFAIFFPEHLFPPPGVRDVLANDDWPDSLTLAAYMAAVTERIRFVTGVSVVPNHPPIQYAKQLATLDVISGGRVILGAGTGWYEEEFSRLGLPFAARGPMTDEYLRAMVELWTAERPSFSGRYISFDTVEFEPKPVQKPHIPIFIGGTGPAPTRRLIELGTGWYPMVGTSEERGRAFADIRSQAEAAGRDPDELWLTGNVYASINPAGQHASQHVSANRVSDRLAAGSTEELVDSVGQQRDLGADLLIVHNNWSTLDELARALSSFATEVMPHFR